MCCNETVGEVKELSFIEMEHHGVYCQKVGYILLERKWLKSLVEIGVSVEFARG